MKVVEIPFTEYYHQFITIEADELTELLKERIDVHDDDCYALCSAYCAEDGMIEFNVLSIGPDWSHCVRGLDDADMLGFFSIEEVYDKEARLPEPDFAMIEKNHAFISSVEQDVDEDLLKTRWDSRLDELRDAFYPDIVPVGIVVDKTLLEYDLCITGICGPFLVGDLEEEPEMDIGIHMDDKIYALPYMYGDEIRLFALFAGDNLKPEEIEARDKIVDEMNRIGFDFIGFSIKS